MALGTTPPCYVGLPAAWTKAMRDRILWTGVKDHASTGAPTPEGTGVLHEEDTASAAHMTILGADRKIVEDLGSVPRSGGQGAYVTDAVDADHVAFLFSLSNGQDASYRWVLYLADRHSNTLRAVAHNPVDAHGHALSGGWLRPVLTKQYLYWIQATPDTTGWGGSELMQYTFATGKAKVLYRGLTEAFVPYGHLILFSALLPHAHPPTGNSTETGPPENVQAVDQATGAPAAPPSGLTIGPDGAETIISDGDLIVWNTWRGALRAWRSSWGKTIDLVPTYSDWPEGTKLGLSAPAMPRLYGHFLAWNPSTDYVLDLHTNSFARLTVNASTEDMSGSQLALEAWTTEKGYDQATGLIPFTQWILDLDTLPSLPGCPAR